MMLPKTQNLHMENKKNDGAQVLPQVLQSESLETFEDELWFVVEQHWKL